MVWVPLFYQNVQSGLDVFAHHLVIHGITPALLIFRLRIEIRIEFFRLVNYWSVSTSFRILAAEPNLWIHVFVCHTSYMEIAGSAMFFLSEKYVMHTYIIGIFLGCFHVWNPHNNKNLIVIKRTLQFWRIDNRLTHVQFVKSFAVILDRTHCVAFQYIFTIIGMDSIYLCACIFLFAHMRILLSLKTSYLGAAMLLFWRHALCESKKLSGLCLASSIYCYVFIWALCVRPSS